MPPEQPWAPKTVDNPGQSESEVLAQTLLDRVLHLMFAVENPPTREEISETIQRQIGKVLLVTADIDETMDYLADVDGYILTLYDSPDTENARVFVESVKTRTENLLGTVDSHNGGQNHPTSSSRRNWAQKENTSTELRQTKTKKLSRPAQQPFYRQTRAELLAQSHLNDRHPVQREILEKILHDITNKGIKTWYIHEPARTGKTAIYIDFIRHYFHYLWDELHLGKRVFIIVPSVILMSQIPDEIEKFFPQVSIGAYYGWEKNLHADVVVMTYTSFNKLVEKGTIRPEDKECLILDEAHEALSDLRQDLIGRFTQSIRLGGTATSELWDERTVEVLLQHQYHRMSILQAVEYWLIAPYHVIYVLTDTDLSWLQIVAGDFSGSVLASRIDTKKRNAIVVDLYKQCFLGKKAIAYCGIVDHSHSLRDDFLLAGVPAVSIDSSPGYDDRDLEAFRRGEYMIATNPFKLVQWFDDPEVEVIFSVRPTFSPRVVGQSCPRGQTLREWKTCSYIIELVDPSSDRFPLLYEEFVLRDHRKTTGDHDFSLEQLREFMSGKVAERGEIVAMPQTINGYMVASTPTAIENLFTLREIDSNKALIKQGITPGDPPDDWPSFMELEMFADIEKWWVNKRLFSILYHKKMKYSTTIRKYRVSTQRAREYMPPDVVWFVYDAYQTKNPSWTPPWSDFSRVNMIWGAKSEQKHSTDTTPYSLSLVDLSQQLDCDISFLETYAGEFFMRNSIAWSFSNNTYEGIFDFDELKKLIQTKKTDEVSIADIADFLRRDYTMVVSVLLETLEKKNMPSARVRKGYICLDDWLAVEKEVNM